MKRKRFSLRTRIFFAMIFLVVIASILIALVAIFQYNEQTLDYHKGRLERKEEAIRTSLDIELQRRTTYEVIEENLALIFKDKIFDISNVNNLDIDIYNLSGKLQISSDPTFTKSDERTDISPEILEQLANSEDHRLVVEEKTKEGVIFQSSYTYINDNKFKPIGILHLPYLQDNSFQEKELKEFLLRLGYVYLLMIIMAIMIAFFVSKYITQSIKTVSEKINKTVFHRRNEKIYLKDASSEIYNLVNAYNGMVDELDASAVKLAKSEREQAWREMAKQVAHEIKNPLTPMRLTVQSFEQRFDPNDPNIQQKVKEFSKSLILQIDTLSSIASAFSNFAEMPKQKSENLNIVKVVKLAIDIFNEPYISFHSKEPEIYAKLDKTQLIRIVTNLVKNAIQSVENKDQPRVEVKVGQTDTAVYIKVADNGKGIEEEARSLIFEPKFTTKTSGMGLGLAMIKNIVEAYQGSITFVSDINKGTVFTVRIPKSKN
ncbi:HAMP domain-containing histidine kinase [Flavobacteriaceae bacterium F08102]|nr:HAMP domain-containing histidine kinase [Flavobacteriaceae bacterium F08102]